MVVCIILYLYYAHAHEPLKLKALQAQKRLNRVKVVKRINSTSLKLARKINPVLKVTRVKAFTYEELAEATDNFVEENQIGQGGYGTVYKGKLQDGKQVAIKRGSIQGAREFYNEIELLSRVHHKNIVTLEGYCDEEDQQMLVYEYVPGGTLRDHLFASSGAPFDFPTRLRIALGAARGILYLHTEANPPIFHRDIKASNILLDSRKVAKVADFGLSCLAPVADLEGVTADHVSTVVKGTPGYLDPEYYMTQQLTDKSDVYSFGVVMLELVTGRKAITANKNLVREAYKKVQEGLLLSMVDPDIAQYATKALEWFIELALRCCAETQEERPTMGDVVSDLEQLCRSHGVSFSMEISKPMSPRLPAKVHHGESPSKTSCESNGGGIWSESQVTPR
ncbi:hypothetical protein KC19_10G016700 [Ceratodon purpureus]|uniref:non-specific serine/threonine protein kinase n=1 Tax=Ceratodon purpureus TaxID=3225 RepID=A0A8T0GGY8_CERPU|nr:hypothetical protein KC19_10G016700 [Ceratodon purpureus]